MTAKSKRKQVTLDLSLRVYPLDAVLGACYRFIDDFFIYLDHPAPRQITVNLLPKNALDDRTLEARAGSFSNELLHELLRVRIGKKTGALREMIVGRALLSAEPLESLEKDPPPESLGGVRAFLRNRLPRRPPGDRCPMGRKIFRRRGKRKPRKRP